MRGRHLHALIGLVALGALLRFATLDARSLWVDEAFTAAVLEKDLGGLWSGIYEGNAPPLYLIVAWPFAKLLGTGEVGLRVLPAVFGTAAITVAYAVCRELATPRAGIVGAALAAVSPLLVWHSQDARPYALLVLLGGLSFLFFLRSLRDGGRGAFVAWAVASALAVATQYFAVFLVAAEAAWLLLASHDRRLAARAVIGVGVTVAALVPLIVEQRQVGQGAFVERLDLGSRIVQVPAQFLVGYQPPLQVASSVVAAAVALVAVWLLLRRADGAELRAARLAAAIGATALLAPLPLALVGADYVLTRYLTAAWIAVAAVAAIGFGARAAGRAGPMAAAALCALFVAVDLGSAWEPKYDRDDWRGAVAASGPPATGRALVVSPAQGSPAFLYYLPSAKGARPRTAPVREIDVVSLAPPYRRIGRKPRPPRPASVPSPAPGFKLAGRRDAEHFTIVRFRASAPRRVDLPQLSRASLSGDAVVLLDRP
jgi:mannosyltransferase